MAQANQNLWTPVDTYEALGKKRASVFRSFYSIPPDIEIPCPPLKPLMKFYRDSQPLLEVRYPQANGEELYQKAEENYRVSHPAILRIYKNHYRIAAAEFNAKLLELQNEYTCTNQTCKSDQSQLSNLRVNFAIINIDNNLCNVQEYNDLLVKYARIEARRAQGQHCTTPRCTGIYQKFKTEIDNIKQNLNITNERIMPKKSIRGRYLESAFDTGRQFK